jgi:predicted mannosyl-3-phosphoglycerate phosphatase (HAD superfamily)
VLQALDIIASNLDVEIFPLSRMTETEAEEATGLEGDELRAARQRLHTEPFLAPAARLEDLQAAAQELDLDVTAGGRFFNIGGGQDKGEAVRLLTAACVGEGSAVVTVGLGDSLNDASLLLAVDYPILIPKPGGVHDPLVLGASVRLCLADLPGPSGWATAIHTILECWESGALSDRTERRKP